MLIQFLNSRWFIYSLQFAWKESPWSNEWAERHLVGAKVDRHFWIICEKRILIYVLSAWWEYSRKGFIKDGEIARWKNLISIIYEFRFFMTAYSSAEAPMARSWHKPFVGTPSSCLQIFYTTLNLLSNGNWLSNASLHGDNLKENERLNGRTTRMERSFVRQNITNDQEKSHIGLADVRHVCQLTGPL